MQTRHRAAMLWLMAATAIALDASGQSLDALRAAREQAKLELLKAQEAFDRADETYIKALGGAAASRPDAPTPAPATAQTAAAEMRPASEVTFSLSGTGALEVSPLDYRARLIVDGHPAEWTQHASGVKRPVPQGTQSLAYEVQNNARSDAVNPDWKTICQGPLTLKPKTTVEIALDHGVTCTTR